MHTLRRRLDRLAARRPRHTLIIVEYETPDDAGDVFAYAIELRADGTSRQIDSLV